MFCECPGWSSVKGSGQSAFRRPCLGTIVDSAIALYSQFIHVLREKELRIGLEPTRKAPRKRHSQSGVVEHSSLAFALPFVVSLRSKHRFSSEFDSPHLPIRPYRLEDSRRSLQRRAECYHTNHRWICLDRDAGRFAALRRRSIRSMDFSKWKTLTLL